MMRWGIEVKAKCEPKKHHRHSIRLKGYDYSQPGAYFITICTCKREMFLNFEPTCQIVQFWWDKLSEKFEGIDTDEFVIMPNHVHGIMSIVGADRIMPAVGAQFIVPRKSGPDKLGLDKSSPYVENNPMVVNQTTLGKIIRFFKARTTHQIRSVTNLLHFKWQRNYYEHIIRNEEELNRVREYIQINPLKWQFDRENPHRTQDKTYDNQWGHFDRGD